MDHWSAEIANLIPRLGCVVKARLSQPADCEGLCLVHGDYRSENICIQKDMEVIPLNYSQAKVAAPATDIASLVTSSQCFGSFHELLEIYQQIMDTGGMSTDFQGVPVACMQLALEVKPHKLTLTLQQLEAWVNFLQGLLEEVER